MRAFAIAALLAVSIASAGCTPTAGSAPLVGAGTADALHPNHQLISHFEYVNGLRHPLKSEYNGTFCVGEKGPLDKRIAPGASFNTSLEVIAEHWCLSTNGRPRFYVKFTDLTTGDWLDVEYYMPKDSFPKWDVRLSHRHPAILVFCYKNSGPYNFTKIVQQGPGDCKGYLRAGIAKGS